MLSSALGFLAMLLSPADAGAKTLHPDYKLLRGEVPDGPTMPAPPVTHRRLSAVPHIVSGFVPMFADNQCGQNLMQNVRSYRFANGVDLWSYACEGGDPSRTYWEMALPGDARAAPLSLPDPRDGAVDAGTLGLPNAIFDFDFGILRAYNFKPGHEDCGTFRAWGYTDEDWQLLERREMPVCKGLDPMDWVRTHYTPTDGPGPDE